jgi:hypothetical protein
MKLLNKLFGTGAEKPNAPKVDPNRIVFINAKGFEYGNVYRGYVMNTSFNVGEVKSYGDKGGRFFGRGDSFGNNFRVGQVTEDGSIYYNMEGLGPDIMTLEGVIKKAKAAEKVKIGRVEVVGGVGILYDKDGAKAGEVHNAGDETMVLGGAFLGLVANHNYKNAFFSQNGKQHDIPKPAKGCTYNDMYDWEKIMRNRYEVHEHTFIKNGYEKGAAIMKEINQKAEEAGDKVAYWESVKKSVLG